ncbi:hypothetical protein EBU71_23580 [bacterium]|nr:hypothetical protein [Candidatus Elulimicrobium humile]
MYANLFGVQTIQEIHDNKQLDKSPQELIEQIIFQVPNTNSVFNFEKVCKRTHLDIASVNTACLLQLNSSNIVEDIHLAAGGVAPFPKYLNNTVAFLKGKELNNDMIKQAIDIMQNEVAPISDARGTKEYKLLLLKQLFLAHIENLINIEELV